MSNRWDIKELGLVSAINYGYTESASSQPIGPKFLRITDIQNDQVEWDSVPYCPIPSTDLAKFRLASGDIVFARTGATTGKSYLVVDPPNAVFASYLIRLRLTDKRLLPEFVSYFFQTEGYWKEVKDGSTGSAQGGFNATKLAALRIPIPTPQEQQRIVCILDDAFESIATAKANAEKNLQNARALFESYLHRIFTQQSKGWLEKSVEALVEEGVLVKPFDGNHGDFHPKKADYTPSGVPFIMASDLRDGHVDTEHCTFISRKLADSLRVGFAKRGDVLVSHKGTIGRSAIVHTDHDYIMLTPQVTSYRIKDHNKLTNRFVRYFFMSPMFQRDMIAGAADGSTRAYIGITKQLSLRFRFPSLAEQKKIVAELDSLDPKTQRLASFYQQKLTALEALKKSLLHQAFAGKL
jgi:type I restriction enzyme, S subunit